MEQPERKTPSEEVRPPGSSPRLRPATDSENTGIKLVSGLITLIGIGLLVFLFTQIFNDPGIQAAQANDRSVVLAFLDSFGIVFPIIMIALGGLLIMLGLRILRRGIAAARWGQIALIWLLVAVIVIGISTLVTSGRPENALTAQGYDLGQALLAALPWLIIAIQLVIALRWISGIMDEIFEGEETLSSRNTRMAWNLLIPTLTLLVLVAARPLEETFITSLTDKRFAGTSEVNFVGFANYTNLFGMRFDSVSCRIDEDTGDCLTDSDGNVRWESVDREILQAGYRPVTTINQGGGRGLTFSGTDRDFLDSVGNTLFYTVISVFLELVMGIFVAMVVNSRFPGRGMMRTAMLVPWAIPTVISARLWEIMLRDNQSGVINKALVDLGVISQSQAWLANSDLQLWALIMVDVWKTTPFMALLLLAGLQTIPADLYEAASVDGASKVRQFISITIPLLRPTIAVALVFRTLDALRAFDVFQVLLGRQRLSMATYNYETLVQAQDGGYASAIGVVIFILIFIFAIAYVRLLGVETE